MTETAETYHPDPESTRGHTVQLLAICRRRHAEARARLQELRKALEESVEYQFWLAQAEEAANEVEAAEVMLQLDALEHYKATGDKLFHPAVRIKLMTRLTYDQRAALAWCWQNLPSAFEFKARRFEQHARATQKTAPFDWVTIETDPDAQIADDLSAYLPTEAPDEAR